MIAAYITILGLVSSVTSQACNQDVILDKLDKITGKLNSLQQELDKFHQQGHTQNYPAESCVDVWRSACNAPSGYYWVKDIQGCSRNVYCDMTKSCGGVTGGWMRIAELDITNSSTTNGSHCPSSLRLRTDSDKRTCGINSNGAACSSVIYNTQDIKYSKVCGKIRAYQYASPDAFGSHGRGTNPSIDTYYVDGVSLTHGSSPRQHIWTFAAALQDQYACAQCGQGSMSIPSFVGRDFFCDTGSRHQWQAILYGHDPLWDGVSWSTCFPNDPPWFYKQLPQPTTDDIEMRVCRDQSSSDEDIAIEKVEIYVR